MFHDGGVGSVALNSPWDLTCLDGMLYIAMAGFHQLWVMHLESGYVGPFAGSGREGIKDGSLRNAMLAQPTGIDTDGDTIYFADSETSAVRTATRGESGKVSTLVGTGLFDFGDKDGVGDRALLQHVQGVCWHEGMLYVTDTYNNKIKRIEPLTQAVVSFTGLGTRGSRTDLPERPSSMNRRVWQLRTARCTLPTRTITQSGSLPYRRAASRL